MSFTICVPREFKKKGFLMDVVRLGSGTLCRNFERWRDKGEPVRGQTQFEKI